MESFLENDVRQLVEECVAQLDRPDLFRKPLVRFAQASDPRFNDLKELIGPWHATPCELMPEAKSVISYFVPYTREVALGPKHASKYDIDWAEAYQEINAGFDCVNNALKAFLESRGHKVVTIPSTHTYDPKDLKASWSHRSIAVIAGLACLGSNRLAITEKGSAGRFCSVITSAELCSSEPPIEQKCLYISKGSCGLCFDACPIGALKPESFDKFACQDRLNENQDEIRRQSSLEDADVCGKCISVCPFCYIE
ncbi:MAG: 4Fe-4S double cluster binding domain-containing protein [Eggerthellaceae bacterium]